MTKAMKGRADNDIKNKFNSMLRSKQVRNAKEAYRKQFYALKDSANVAMTAATTMDSNRSSARLAPLPPSPPPSSLRYGRLVFPTAMQPQMPTFPPVSYILPGASAAPKGTFEA